MKLFYTPGACSLSPHIILRETGQAFDLERVEFRAKTTELGRDYKTINPKGYVPALLLDNGEILTEATAIIQYIADLNGDAKLAPKHGTLDRARLQEHLSYISSEMHKSFAPLFTRETSREGRQAAVADVAEKFDVVESVLADDRDYLVGNVFSVADVHLYVISSWAVPTKIGLDKWPHIAALAARVGARASVVAARAAEGLSG